MLQFWLTEPERVVFAVDVWSSERALSRPRGYTTADSGESKARKTDTLLDIEDSKCVSTPFANSKTEPGVV